jgi:hypothetical protein
MSQSAGSDLHFMKDDFKRCPNLCSFADKLDGAQ